jgi:hypothetical protein
MKSDRVTIRWASGQLTDIFFLFAKTIWIHFLKDEFKAELVHLCSTGVTRQQISNSTESGSCP